MFLLLNLKFWGVKSQVGQGSQNSRSKSQILIFVKSDSSPSLAVLIQLAQTNMSK